METPKTPSKLTADAAKSVPDQPITDEEAEGVAGGLMGGDDDLEDLEVER